MARVALVTGGTRGIGEAICQRLKKQGHLVVANYGGNVEKAQAFSQATELPAELTRARDLWTRKFGAAPADRREWAKQARFMQARGFSTDVIRHLLREPEES